MNSIPEITRQVRGEMSQTDFARLIGVSVARLNHWEMGRRLPSYEILYQLSQGDNEPARDWALKCLDARSASRVQLAAGHQNIDASIT